MRDVFDEPVPPRIAQEVAPFKPMFLEEPVPPRIPMVSPDLISRLMSAKAYFSAVLEYLKLTLSNLTLPFSTSLTPFSGLTRSDFCSRTSAIRRADSADMVIMTNTIASIIKEDRICTP